MELNKKERLILWNQYEILRQLDQDNAEEYESIQEILANGFEYDYDYLVRWMEDTPVIVSQEVRDILQMFRCLTFSFDNLDDKTGVEREDYLFKGFDGNEEIKHYAYAKWLIEKQEMYQEFKNCDLNSHWTKLNTYMAMLDRFYQILNDNGYDKNTDSLSLEELNFIIDK